MNDIQPIGQTEIEMKIKEADTCHSMGMIREALQVYEQVLSDLSENDGPIRETIGTKITQLKKEMEVQQEADSQARTLHCRFRRDRTERGVCQPGYCGVA